MKNYIPPSVQETLVKRTLERYLQNPENKTNLHPHYNIPYPKSNLTLLDMDNKTTILSAKNSLVHPNLTLERALTKKLRWITLGGQYNWTSKSYPPGDAPRFPSDLYDLIHGIVPATEPEAAIINFYSPGDTLSLHRDVSEHVSIHIVCGFCKL